MSQELEPALEAEQERNMMIVRLTAEGRSKNYIQSQTNAPPALQRKVMEEFNHYARNDLYTQQRAREIIGLFDEHTASLIEQMYEVVSEADMNGLLKEKAAAIKNIFEMEIKRVEALQKAGVLSAQNIGDEVAQAQIKHEKILALLKSIAQKHPSVAKEIAEGIADINNEVIATRVVDE